jgi:hypothetical protein
VFCRILGLNRVGHTSPRGFNDIIGLDDFFPVWPFGPGRKPTKVICDRVFRYRSKEVLLKGIRQNGETNKSSDYKIDFNNVIQLGQRQNLVLFPDSSAQGFTITKAKLVDEQKQTINLNPVAGQQNTFSPNGVYTLQAVGSLGNTDGGHEAILVVPVLTEETKKVVQNRINQILFVDIYAEIIFE